MGYLLGKCQRNPSSRFGRHSVIACAVQQMQLGTLLNFISHVFPCDVNFESKERKFAPLETLKLG